MLSTTIFEEVSSKSLSLRFQKSIVHSGEHPPYEMPCCVLVFLSSNLDLDPIGTGQEIRVPPDTFGQLRVCYYLQHLLRDRYHQVLTFLHLQY